MSEIDQILQIATNEIGYLEKASNKDLDSKTANAGSGNYTKYWRDLAPKMNGSYWCQCFVNWCFNKAFGTDKAKAMLYMPSWNYYTPAAAGYFKNNNAWKTSNPQKGDIIYFKNSIRIHHVGIVYNVDSSYVYTIEGNSNSSSSVISNGGSVVSKKYSLNNGNIAGYGTPKYSSSTTSSTSASFKSVGIDLSMYNNVTDYTKVKNAGVNFAILKITQKDGSKDPLFEKHYYGCLNSGITVQGVYNYSYATSTSQAEVEANNVIKALNERCYPVYLDIEDSCQKGLGSKLIDIINAYKNIIEKAGLEFYVYTGLSFYNSYIKPYSSNAEFIYWIARYGKNDGTYNESYKPDISNMEIWQYTSKGILPGIDGNVDMDVMFDLAKITNGTDVNFTETPITMLGKVKATKLNLRSAPSTNSSILNTFSNNTIIPLIAKTSNGWFKYYGGGYLSGDYIDYLSVQVSNCNNLNVRSAPNKETNNIIKTVSCGTKALAMNHGNGWYQLLFSDNTIGWCSDKYITSL